MGKPLARLRRRVQPRSSPGEFGSRRPRSAGAMHSQIIDALNGPFSQTVAGPEHVESIRGISCGLVYSRSPGCLVRRISTNGEDSSRESTITRAFLTGRSRVGWVGWTIGGGRSAVGTPTAPLRQPLLIGHRSRTGTASSLDLLGAPSQQRRS